MELHEAERILRDVPRHGDLDQAAVRMFAEQAALRLSIAELTAILRGEESTAEELRAKLDTARADLAASAQTAARFEHERDELDAENLRLREQAGEMATELDAARAEGAALRAQANCGEGHDVQRICCAHAKDVKELRVRIAELESERAELVAKADAPERPSWWQGFWAAMAGRWPIGGRWWRT